MKVLDIISWLPSQEVSLEQLKQIFVDYKKGLKDDSYIISSEIPNHVMENVLKCKKELIAEGKKVACILKEDSIIALIGYKE